MYDYEVALEYTIQSLCEYESLERHLNVRKREPAKLIALPRDLEIVSTPFHHLALLFVAQLPFAHRLGKPR